MEYLINGSKIYETNPPFAAVGEIRQIGDVQLISLTEKEEKGIKGARRGRIPKARNDGLEASGETGVATEKLIPETP